MKTKCAYCSNELDRRPCRIKERNYCNATCQNKYEYFYEIRRQESTSIAHEAVRQKGLHKFKTNPTTKIGKRGYKLIYIPKLADYYKKGWVYYHHYIWCSHNKKELESGYCIHHIDENSLNNSIDNLEYMTIVDHNKLKKKLPNGKTHYKWREGNPRIGTEYICGGCNEKKIRVKYNQKCCSLSCASKKRWNNNKISK